MGINLKKIIDINYIDMKIKYITSLLMIVFLFSYGCDTMEDNYKEYLGEYNYPGKVKNLRVYPGFERVVLAWDNPKAQKTKSIRILYGTDSTQVDYETLVDSVSIDGLDDGTGYEFIVYTLDAQKNLSVPVSLTAFPISQDFVDNLTPPSMVVEVQNNQQVITMIGLSNVLMTFSGLIDYTITGPNDFLKSGQIDARDKVISIDPVTGLKKINTLNNYSLPVAAIGVNFLPPGEYKFKFAITAWPIMGSLLSVDEVSLDNEITSTVQPIIINVTSLGGSVSDPFNTTGGEGIEKLIDGDLGSKYLTRNKKTWALFKGSAPSLVTRYSLTSANDDANRDPKNWTLEGSNNGTDWTLLDTRIAIEFPLRRQTQTFEIVNKTTYSYYKLSMENKNSDLFQLAEWTLYGPKME